MRRILSLLTLAVLSVAAYAQEDLQKAAAEAALAITSAPEAEVQAPKPTWWTIQTASGLNFSRLGFSHWAAGGNNTTAFSAALDAIANYARGKTAWNNRLQLDYGFLFSEDKPIVQKNKDRIYLESVWGYASPVRNISYSAQFSFKTQFGDNYKYGTPTGEDPTVQDWLDARTLKSAYLSPAYIDLGVGAKWSPTQWLTVNFAPLTGGVVIAQTERLRKTYGMKLMSPWDDYDALTEEQKAIYADAVAAGEEGRFYHASKFQLGAKLTIDAGFKINDNFRYTTQLVLFSDYLDKPLVPRVNWDNKIDWKLTKFFALTFSTYLIYDHTVLDTDLGRAVVQFKDYFEFGFSYTFGPKKV